MKKLITFLIIMSGVVVAYLPGMAFNTSNTGLSDSGKEAGFNTGQTDLPVLIGNIVRGFLVMTDIVLMIVVIYGGIRYMIAGGNEDEVKKAKRWIINGVIGLIIISLAYAFSTFVLSRLGAAVTGA